MRKTKRRKKISKFTNKKGGMLRLRSMLGFNPTRTTAITILPPFGTIEAAIVILENITNLIVQKDFTNMDKMKGDIFEMTTIVGELSDSKKIEFVENDVMASITPESREIFRNEIKNGDTLFFQAINEKYLMLTPEQRDTIEAIIDKVISGEEIIIEHTENTF